MVFSIKQRLDVERKLTRLVQLNDAIVQQMQALAPLLDQIGGLSPTARAKLVDVLTAMGVSTADFDALVAALGSVRQTIENKLTLQQP